MRMYDIIGKKRDKKELSKEDIDFFINEYCSDNIPDDQVSSLLMAIFLNGMTKEEILNLTLAMANSSGEFDLSSIGKTIVDKHSTGGIGDEISLIVLSCVASLGVPIAKMSGRGLGYTGGTIDKLESIKGIKLNFTFEQFIANVKKIGICHMMQTEQLDLADKKIYALRDTTATIESIPLIASSIMSKKIASGANKIVLDVTVGSGAFMKTKERAIRLAKTMIDIGKSAGIETVAVITSMNEPVGKMIGNSMELKEAIQFLKSNQEERTASMKDLEKVVLEIGSQMLKLGGISNNVGNCKKMILESLDTGKAYQMFETFVQNQGGNIQMIRNMDLLPKAKYTYEFKAKEAGYISKINGARLGEAVVVLGGGREKKEDRINYGVGIEMVNKIGAKLDVEDTILIVHYDDEVKLKKALNYIKKAIHIIKEKPKKKQIILGTIS